MEKLRILPPEKAKANARAKVKKFQLEKKRAEHEEKMRVEHLKAAPKEEREGLLWHNAKMGNKAMVERLLNMGTDVNTTGGDAQGFTVLMTAALNDRIEVVKLLVGADADLNIMVDRRTALNMARAEVSALLRSKGAKRGSEFP